VTDRRHFLHATGAGFGAVALAGLGDRAAAGGVRIDPTKPLTPRPPHFAPKAKRVIHLFMWGAPGSMDTFDYKPELLRLNGKPTPASILDRVKKLGGLVEQNQNQLFAGPWKWKRHGQSGLWASELFAETARHADDLCVVKSLTVESANHGPAMHQWNTGVVLAGKPSMGAWATYGLGSENQNLPGYVVLYKVAPVGGPTNWGAGFLPAAFQGTSLRADGPPVLNAAPPPEFAAGQRATLDFVGELNRRHAAARPGLGDLDGRVASYELAYRMQAEALALGDLSKETKETRDLYGVDDPDANVARFARMCLQARRLAEKGVRFVQVYSAMDKEGWDAHSKLEANHRLNARMTDRPIAALLTDLKRRGLFDDTLVMWGGEFGRTPTLQSDGRNHNPLGCTAWLAGGGVKGGQSIGETDAVGYAAEADPHPVKDLHATLLHGLGLRCDNLFFEQDGRQERLTGVAGTASVIPGVFGG
jgi:hypothetical protein